MSRGFDVRLKAAKKRSGLWDAELARFLERPHSTVRSWLLGHAPREAVDSPLMKLMTRLENLIKAGVIPLKTQDRVEREKLIGKAKRMKL